MKFSIKFVLICTLLMISSITARNIKVETISHSTSSHTQVVSHSSSSSYSSTTYTHTGNGENNICINCQMIFPIIASYPADIVINDQTVQDAIRQAQQWVQNGGLRDVKLPSNVCIGCNVG